MGSNADDDSASIGPIRQWTPWSGLEVGRKTQTQETVDRSPAAVTVRPAQDEAQGGEGIRPWMSDRDSAPPGLSGAHAVVIKRLSFVFYSEAGTALVRVYDARTGELLREIPPRINTALSGPDETAKPDPGSEV